MTRRPNKWRVLFAFLHFSFALIYVVRAQGSELNQANSNPSERSNSTLALMPIPSSIRVMPGRLSLDSTFILSEQGYTDERQEKAIDRTLHRLEARANLAVPRKHERNRKAKLVIRTDAPGMKIQGIEEDESYTLEINSQQAVLHAHTVVGTLRGLETLIQLLDADRDGFFFPLVHIEDKPRFPWRGLLLDVSRHWEPVEIIKRTLDSMAVVKLDVFHWHLSDDQGFRVESKVFPLLHQLGSDGSYYTQAEIKEIIAYARDRGIRVVPEFDMPGHAHAWFIGYPQFASAPGPYVFKYYIGGDSVPFDPSKEQTYDFIDKFIGEMASLFPDKYWHVGGDEVDGTPWDTNSEIQAFKARNGLKDNVALQVYFNQRVLHIVQKHGKQMVGWDEILNPELPKDTVVESWTGLETLVSAAEAGYNGILAAPYYLDKMFKTTSYYAGDPLPSGSDLNPTQAAQVLGGEVCMWGELVSEENVESRIWPYAAAVAERLWSPREITDTEDMYRRLDVVSLRLEEAGSRHLTNPAAMLRLAAGGEVSNSVQTFLGLLEPLRLGLRQEQRRPTQLMPLTALGDIVVADPPTARQFDRKVAAFLKDTPHYVNSRDELSLQFQQWEKLKQDIAVLADRAPVFRDAEGAAADLSDLGAAGEQATSFIATAQSPPPEWLDRQRSLIERATKSKGLLRIAVLHSMEQLFMAAGHAGKDFSPGSKP
jgi:hexosaminidase